MAVSRVQQAFRFRTDSTAAQGGTPVWAAAQNANYSPLPDTPFRLRVQLENTGTTSPVATTYNIFVSVNGGAYVAVPTASSGNPVFCTDATAGASANQSAITTALLTGGVTTWLNGQYASAGGTSTFILTAAGYTEVEFGLQINSAVAAQGDTYAFRVYFSNTTAFQNYTVTPIISPLIYVSLASAWSLDVGIGAYAPSAYGKGAYGKSFYSKGVMAPVTGLTMTETLAGSLALPVTLTANLALAPIDELAGVLSPALTIRTAVLSEQEEFAGSLSFTVGINGNLTTQPFDNLAGVLSFTIGLSGDFRLSGTNIEGVLNIQPGLSAALSTIETLAGAWSLSVGFQGSLGEIAGLGGALVVSIAIGTPPDMDVITAPLWGSVVPCPPPMWTPETPCPTPPWVPINNWQPSLYGLGGYGLGLYGLGGVALNYVPSVYGTGPYSAGPYGLGQVGAGLEADVWVPATPCGG